MIKMINGKAPGFFFFKFLNGLLIFCFSYYYFLDHLNDHNDYHNDQELTDLAKPQATQWVETAMAATAAAG